MRSGRDCQSGEGECALLVRQRLRQPRPLLHSRLSSRPCAGFCREVATAVLGLCIDFNNCLICNFDLCIKINFIFFRVDF